MIDDYEEELTAEERAEQERIVEEMTARIEADANDGEAYHKRGGAYVNLRQFEAALADCNKVVELNPGAATYANRGSVYSSLAQFDAALADFNKAIELNPKHPAVYYNRGNAYIHLKQYKPAIADCSKAITLDPKFINADINRSNAYNSLKQHDAALADCNKVIELDPNNANAYNCRGIAHNGLKQHESAIANYSKAIELNPNYTTAYINRSVSYNDLAQYEAALADLNKAIELTPNNTNAYSSRGLVYHRLQQYEVAIANFNKAIKLDPNNTNAYSRLGAVYGTLKQYEAAIDNFKKAIELDPNEPTYAHDRAATMAFQASEKDREEMSARLEEGFNEKLSEALENQAAEFNAEAGQLFGNLKGNVATPGGERDRHGRNAFWLIAVQIIIFVTWLSGLMSYFYENVIDVVGFRHPMAILPYISIALVVSTPIIWGLKIIGQNILEAKSLEQDAMRRLFVENNLTRLIGGKPEEQEIRQKMLSGYFTSWQSNSPVEILLKLNSRRIGPETLLDRILPTGSKQDYSKPDDKQDNSKPDGK